MQSSTTAATPMTREYAWSEATPRNTCPLCNTGHWCYLGSFAGSIDKVICGRTDFAPNGWVEVGRSSKDDRPIFTKSEVHEAEKAEWKEQHPTYTPHAIRREVKSPVVNQAPALPPPPLNLDLVTSLVTHTQFPEWKEISRDPKDGTKEKQVEYYYSDRQRVVRKQWDDRRVAYKSKGRERNKVVLPEFWYELGEEGDTFSTWKLGRGSEPWGLYREPEVRELVYSGSKVVFWVGGEQNVESARELGLVAFCNQGGENSHVLQVVNFVAEIRPELFVVWPDNDDDGAKMASKIQKECDRQGVRVLILEPESIWIDMPVKGDITNVVKVMSKDQIIQRLQEQIDEFVAKFGKSGPQSKAPRKQTGKLQEGDLALEIADEYSRYLAWHTKLKKWYQYEGKSRGVWSFTEEEFVAGLVGNYVQSVYGQILSVNKLKNVVYLLRIHLRIAEFEEMTGFLPFTNGLLNLTTNAFSAHDPSYHTTWSLPYEYQRPTPGGTREALIEQCQPIWDWLLESMGGIGNEQLAELLVAYLAAVIRGRVDLQRYLECIGPAGTGKGTFIRLAEALIGTENRTTTTFSKLEKGNFEMAKVSQGRLIAITDAESWAGEASNLNALTGQDSVSGEQKNVQEMVGDARCAKGMVILAGNQLPRSLGNSPGLQRRRITVNWNNQPSPEHRKNLISFMDGKWTGDFVPYLPAFLNLVLDYSDQEIVGYVRDTHIWCPRLADSVAEAMTESNPLAAWADEELIWSGEVDETNTPKLRAKVGRADRDKDSQSKTQYLHVGEWLYPSYCEWCVSNGYKPIPALRFTKDLVSLFENQLKLHVFQKTGKGGSFIYGIALRDGDENFTRPVSQVYVAKVTAKSAPQKPQTIVRRTEEVNQTISKVDPNNPPIDLVSEAMTNIQSLKSTYTPKPPVLSPVAHVDHDDYEVGFGFDAPTSPKPTDFHPPDNECLIHASASIQHQGTHKDVIAALPVQVRRRKIFQQGKDQWVDKIEFPMELFMGTSVEPLLLERATIIEDGEVFVKVLLKNGWPVTLLAGDVSRV